MNEDLKMREIFSSFLLLKKTNFKNFKNDDSFLGYQCTPFLPPSIHPIPLPPVHLDLFPDFTSLSLILLLSIYILDPNGSTENL